MSIIDFSETQRAPLDGSAPESVIGVDDRPPEPVDPAHMDALRRGLDAERSGEIATDDEVRAAFARLRA